uniref:Methyltransferase domain-containing protein n=1 Tax=Coccidioides posadasii RMSCC 3488 TaxID=454284 RepID=A0A0J6EVL0_COCPO|nr:hypothetical protein CPAG_00938 [Coccidioides posadasii RMSCC 3488]
MPPNSTACPRGSNKSEAIWRDPKIVADYRSAEKVTVVFAKSLVEQSGILSTAKEQTPLVILDNACGTGAVSMVLHDMLNDLTGWKLTCADFSEAMIDAVKDTIKHEGWKNTDTAIADLQETGFSTAHYTHVFASFAIMALPNSQAGLDECLRILKPGGTVAFTTWKKSGWSEDVNAAIATMPGNLAQPTPEEFLMSLGNGDEWHDPSWVKAQLWKRGLENIQVNLVSKTIATSTVPETIPALAPIMAHIPAKFWNEKQRQKSAGSLASTVSSYLETKYGTDKPIPMHWIAVVATAQKPIPLV